MSIKTLWNKFLVWAEYKKEPIKTIPVAIVEPDEGYILPPIPVSHKRAVEMKKGREAKLALIDAFYGTLIDRTPEESNPVNKHKKKHAHDGWRHGVSHPLLFGGRTYDVQKRRDDSREQFEELMAELELMAGE